MDQKVILKALDEQYDLIEYLCKHGVHTEDHYDQVCEIIDLLMRIDELTEVQKLSLETLCSVTGDYQEKHYPYGN